MLVMGFAGGFDRINSGRIKICHDSAAVLLQDGKVIAAFEEERLNRIKHTDKFASRAIQACLDSAGKKLGDLDRLAFNFTEESAFVDLVTRVMQGERVSTMLGLDPVVDTNPRALLSAVLERELGTTLDPDRFHFVKHHLAHAFSAFGPSGFDQALVVTMDGQGNDEAGYVATADEHGLNVLSATSVQNSLGLLYTHLTHFLGFTYHDEFKVMGLVPYGDPAVYREPFKQFYTLHPEGGYELHSESLLALAANMPPRVRSEPFEQMHKDLAAALQEALETIVFHVLRHYQKVTGLKNLCLAGGVGHNCTLNGKILASGLFSNVYVQPASHDAGCALGAALFANCDGVPGTAKTRAQVMPHLYLGSDVGGTSAVESALARWEPLLVTRKSPHVEQEAARLLASGSVIGWVQSRAEFGPRALGNRSIVADPRPAENKEIINAMVKKREGFRPFAPSVLAERANEFFEIPEAVADLGHMTYVLSVRPDKRALLGAVTHVDGSARVQTVARSDNARYWGLIHAFGELTGTPVVLNTSFNNNAEPIVDSVDDAVVSFLTTKLNHLVVGDFIAEKRELTLDRCRTLVPFLCAHVSLNRVKSQENSGAFTEKCYLANTHDTKTAPVSMKLCKLLNAADGKKGFGELVVELELANDGAELLAEFVELWSKRLVTLLPPK